MQKRFGHESLTTCYDYLGKFTLFSWVILFNVLLFEMNKKFANHPNFGKANIRVRISIMVRELSRVRTFVQALVYLANCEKYR